jgi:hypothetical protein
MVYLSILCNLILISTVFEPSKINYARGLMKPAANFDFSLIGTITRWAFITQSLLFF